MKDLETKEEIKNTKKSDELLNDPEVISDLIFWFIDNEKNPRGGNNFPCYYNAMTDKKGETLDSVIREGKRYIVKSIYSRIDIETVKKKAKIYGLYLYFDKVENVLRLFFAKFTFACGNWRWTAISEGIITKKGKSSIDTPSTMERDFDDICGQYIASQYKSSEYVSGKTGYNNFPSGAVETLNDFFGVFPYFLDIREPYKILTEPFSSYLSVITTIRKFYYSEKIQIHAGEKMYVWDNGYGYVDSVDIPDAPKEALETIKDIEKKRILINGLSTSKTNIHKYNIIHKIGNCAYQRFFFAFPCFDCYGNLEIKLSEHKVIKLGRYICDDVCKMMTGNTVWCDDLSGTIIEHTGKYILEWLQCMKKYFCKYDVSEISDGTIQGKHLFFNTASEFTSEWLKEEKNEYGQRNYLSPCLCVFMAVMAAYNPVVEMLLNFGGKEAEVFRREITFRIVSRRKIPTTALNEIFGRMYWNAKTPDKALGVPKGTLKLIIEHSTMDIYAFGVIRRAFGKTKEGRQYLKRMNRSDFEFLIDFWKESHIGYILFDILERLICIFGVSRWKKYVEYLKNADFMEKPEDYTKYLKYLEMLYVLGDDIKKAKWRVTGKEFSVLFNELTTLVTLDKDKGEFRTLMEKWEPMCQKYKQQYEFSENGFKIVVPQSPGELVREGLLLEHCVGTFVNKMAEGRTIILFIRREGEENTPYYTLEIRNDQIRQCHGKNNINANDRLKMFLQRFCEKKDIIYSKGYDLLDA